MRSERQLLNHFVAVTNLKIQSAPGLQQKIFFWKPSPFCCNAVTSIVHHVSSTKYRVGFRIQTIPISRNPISIASFENVVQSSRCRCQKSDQEGGPHERCFPISKCLLYFCVPFVECILGKAFWVCASERESQCKFFCWDGETPKVAPSQSVNSATTPSCACDKPSTLRSVESGMWSEDL